MARLFTAGGAGVSSVERLSSYWRFMELLDRPVFFWSEIPVRGFVFSALVEASLCVLCGLPWWCGPAFTFFRLFHEIGHVHALKKNRVAVDAILFIPPFIGGTVHDTSFIPQNMWMRIKLEGPLYSWILLSIAQLPIGVLSGHLVEQVWLLYTFCAYTSLLNLLPQRMLRDEHGSDGLDVLIILSIGQGGRYVLLSVALLFVVSVFTWMFIPWFVVALCVQGALVIGSVLGIAPVLIEWLDPGSEGSSGSLFLSGALSVSQHKQFLLGYLLLFVGTFAFACVGLGSL